MDVQELIDTITMKDDDLHRQREEIITKFKPLKRKLKELNKELKEAETKELQPIKKQRLAWASAVSFAQFVEYLQSNKGKWVAIPQRELGDECKLVNSLLYQHMNKEPKDHRLETECDQQTFALFQSIEKHLEVKQSQIKCIFRSQLLPNEADGIKRKFHLRRVYLPEKEVDYNYNECCPNTAWEYEDVTNELEEKYGELVRDPELADGDSDGCWDGARMNIDIWMVKWTTETQSA